MHPNPDQAPRQLVLLCDGTNNNLTGRRNDTNLVKLAELLAASPDAQRLLCYDPGVGNPGELPGATTWDQLQRRLERIGGLAFGRGVFENMAESYLFLMRHYSSGEIVNVGVVEDTGEPVYLVEFPDGKVVGVFEEEIVPC